MSIKIFFLAIALFTAFNKDNSNKVQKKQFIYTLRYNNEYKANLQFGAKEQTAAREHVAYLRELLSEGNCYMAGRTPNIIDTSLFGIIVFDAANLDAAKEIMNNDPMIKENIMVGELRPFTIVLFKQ